MKIHARLALLCALCLLSGCALQPDVPTASSGSLSQQEDTQTQTVIDATSLLSADTGLLNSYLRDSVTMSASSDGGTFDPYSHSSLLATNLIFQSLVRLDNQGNIRYELAKSVEQVDELHYTITLWDGIHDSEGNPLTTSDVVFSIELLQQTGNGSQVNKLDHLEIVDDLVLTWVCTEPFGAGELEKQLSDPKIVTKAAYEAYDFSTHPVGTGSYVLTSYVPESTVVITADEHFWMKDLPSDVRAGLWVYDCQNVREITFIVIPDASTRAIALETGAIDIADALDAEDAERFQESNTETVISLPVLPPATLTFNCSSASPCSEVALRKAICYGLDNEAIISELNCPATVAYGISPRMYDAPEEWQSWRDYYNYDPDQATALLEQSSYDGSELTVLYSNNTANAALAHAMQTQLGALGIRVVLYCFEGSGSPMLTRDETAWDIRIDEPGGSNYIGKILYKYSSMDTIQLLQGKNLMLIEDETLDGLCASAYNVPSEENLAAWDTYFTYEQCYGYAVFCYAEQTACRSNIRPAFGTRYSILPNACTFDPE